MPIVMDAERIARTLTRIAHEILERNKGVDDLALVGIQRRGVPLAKRIAGIIRQVHDVEPPSATETGGPSKVLLKPVSGTGKAMAFCCMFMAATTICLPFRILSNMSLDSSIWT